MDIKTLTNEYKVEIDKYGTLVYGSPDEDTCEIIEFIMKGRFIPLEYRKDYTNSLKNVKNRFIEIANSVINTFEWFDKHYILITDFTETGIKYEKSNKYKYKIFIKPKERGEIRSFEPRILEVVGKINVELDRLFKQYGFTIYEEQ